MRINQNISAMAALRNLSTNNDKMTKSLDKLSSGFRINRAADDAAGLVISEGLRSQVGGIKVAMRNAQDGISVVQTAEGALTEVHSILQRMRDLTVQAANTGTNGSAALNAIDDEMDALVTEIDRIGETTKFNGVELLKGAFGVTAAKSSGFDANDSITVAGTEVFTINVNSEGAVTVNLDVADTYTGEEFAAYLQDEIRGALTTAGQTANADAITVSAESVGAGTAITINAGIADGDTFAIADTTGTLMGTALGFAATSSAAAGSGGVFQVGANVSNFDKIEVAIQDLRATALGVNSIDVTDTSTHAAALTAIDAAIATVSDERGKLGALQNRFEHTIANLGVAAENISASESRIRDVDMASEMAAFTRNQIMTQAGTAMLAQANATSQNVLSLLR